jgi:hypothetical protein
VILNDYALARTEPAKTAPVKTPAAKKD